MTKASISENRPIRVVYGKRELGRTIYSSEWEKVNHSSNTNSNDELQREENNRLTPHNRPRLLTLVEKCQCNFIFNYFHSSSLKETITNDYAIKIEQMKNGKVTIIYGSDKTEEFDFLITQGYQILSTKRYSKKPGDHVIQISTSDLPETAIVFSLYPVWKSGGFDSPAYRIVGNQLVSDQIALDQWLSYSSDSLGSENELTGEDEENEDAVELPPLVLFEGKEEVQINSKGEKRNVDDYNGLEILTGRKAILKFGEKARNRMVFNSFDSDTYLLKTNNQELNIYRAEKYGDWRFSYTSDFIGEITIAIHPENLNEVSSKTVMKSRKIKDMALSTLNISATTFQIYITEGDNSLGSKMINFSESRSVQKDTIPYRNSGELNPLGVDEIFKVVQEMPRFPGCEGNAEMSSEQKRNCSNEKLLEYLFANLTYPKLARENGVEGRVYIQFIVEKDSSVREVKVVRNIGAGCGEAAPDVVNGMNDLEEKWRPGYQRGVPVRVLYTLPVTFKLDDEEKSKSELLKEVVLNGKRPLYVINGKKFFEDQELPQINSNDIEKTTILVDE